MGLTIKEREAKARADLAEQVSKGWINQAQADAELARLASTGWGRVPSGPAPAAAAPAPAPKPMHTLEDAKRDLQQQVASGGISQAQADAEYNRLKSTGYGGAAPAPSTPSAPTATAQPPARQLDEAKANLQTQVQRGWITQAQADAELTRLQSQQGVTAPNVNPALLQAQNNLQDQVAKGWINQAQADAEYNRLVASSQPPYTSPELKLDTPSQVITTTFDAARGAQTQGNLLTNPNQINPFGQQAVTIDPITGQPTVTQGLSKANQQVVGGVQQGSIGASNVMGSLLGGGAFGSLVNAPQGGGAAIPESNYERAVFDQLTRGMNDQRARDREQLQQTLANRGIPMGSQLYNQQVDELENRYDEAFQEARNSAVQQTQQSTLGALGTLSGIGQAGFYNPNFQPFQSVGYQQPDINSIFNAFQGADLNKQQLGQSQQQIDLQKAQFEWQKQQAAKAGSGGGGGGSRQPSAPKPPPSPFHNTLPPGS